MAGAPSGLEETGRFCKSGSSNLMFDPDIFTEHESQIQFIPNCGQAYTNSLGAAELDPRECHRVESST